MKDKQGQKANKNGKDLENKVQKLFESKGFTTLSYIEWEKSQDEYSEVLIKGFPYQTIYYPFRDKKKAKTTPFLERTNSNGSMEFLLISKALGFRVRIECRSQINEGSVIEKFSYLLANAFSPKHEKNTIIVYDGTIFDDKGAIGYIKNEIEKYKRGGGSNNVLIYDLEDFEAWTDQVFIKVSSV